MINKAYKTGYSMYFTGILFLGILNFKLQEFAMTWPRPLPQDLQYLNPGMAYITGAILSGAAIFALAKRHIIVAAITIAGLILLLLIPRHLYNHWRDNINGFKALVLISGALLAGTAGAIPAGKKNIIYWLSFVAVFLFFMVCGYTHLHIGRYVQYLIPDFIPFRLFFTHFTGICLLSGGVGLLLPKTRAFAALLSGVMITGWFFLLHLPRAFNQQNSYGEWTSVGESFALAGICFMIYGISKPVAVSRRV